METLYKYFRKIELVYLYTYNKFQSTRFFRLIGHRRNIHSIFRKILMKIIVKQLTLFFCDARLKSSVINTRV